MHARPVHLFKYTKYSHISEVLTLNDILYWGGDAFVSVIMALFVTQYIEGGTASSIGISWMIYRLFTAITTVQVGKFLDKHKGYVDEVWALFFVSILAGISYILLSFATQVWHLYFAMAVLGLLRSFDINAWKIIFYSHLEEKTKGRTIGTYDAAFSISLGAIYALAGFIGDAYGFRNVIILGGVLIILGGFPVLSLRKDKTL
ncbi:MFS transporter [Patescibacteria group bacterium]